MQLYTQNNRLGAHIFVTLRTTTQNGHNFICIRPSLSSFSSFLLYHLFLLLPTSAIYFLVAILVITPD